VHAVFPLHIGSHSATEYSIGTSIIDIMEIYPQIMESPAWMMGHVHSHHVMDTAFSMTDMNELHSNASQFLYYLSLIVNFRKKYSAKIAIHAKEEDRRLTHKDETGAEISSIIKGKEKLILISCDVKIETAPVEDWFQKQFTKIDEAPKQEFGWYNTKQDIEKKKYEDSLMDVAMTNLEISQLCAKWLALDMLSEDLLTEVLHRVEREQDISNYRRSLIAFFPKVFAEAEQRETIDGLLDGFRGALVNRNGPDFTIWEAIEDALDVLEMQSINPELPYD